MTEYQIVVAAENAEALPNAKTTLMLALERAADRGDQLLRLRASHAPKGGKLITATLKKKEPKE